MSEPNEAMPPPQVIQSPPATINLNTYDRDLWRTLGNIESGVNQLLQRETKQDERMDNQDKRMAAVERKVWMFSGAGLLIAAITLRWEAVKAFFGH